MTNHTPDDDRRTESPAEASESSAARQPTDDGWLYTDGGHQQGHRRPEVLSEEALRDTFPDYEGQVTASRHLDARHAETVPPETVLDPDLASRLDTDLFSHQAEALEYLGDGENVVVTTSTSSGKTWVYALQIARNQLADSDSTALCLYPMKALTRDQQQELGDKLNGDWDLNTYIDVYDGDTPQDRKREIRNQADVILTNPAGLNVYLPRHNRDSGWHRFYANLDLVVVDEAHEYTGITGTHVTWILRRLRRILQYYESEPQFVMTTATIGNPATHARRLTDEDFRIVDEDGSPRGERDVVLWQPPTEWDSTDGQSECDNHSDRPAEPDPMDDGGQFQASASSEAAKVTTHLAVNDIQTLEFCSARQATEIAAKQMISAAQDHPIDNYIEVESYHAGLGKKSRRSVENKLKMEEVDAVASTNALELGIDIGSVDATVTAGYPGTKQSFWQQVGRSGRGTADALSVLVGGQDAMDGYILDHPEYLFDESVEDAVVSIDNDHVYADHLLAAANERPLTIDDAGVMGDEQRLREMVDVWQEAGVLDEHGQLEGRGVTYTGDYRPQGRISIYKTSGREFTVVCSDGEIDHDPIAEERAYRDYHKGALFLHGGQQYEVAEVEEESRNPRIIVEEVQTGNYTQTLSRKSISNLTVTDHRDLGGGFDLYFGTGTVTVEYNQYLIRKIKTGEVIGGPMPTGSPPLTLDTELLWVTLPPDHISTTLDRLDVPLLSPTGRADRDALVPEESDRYTYAGGIHAAEHGVIQLAPLELLVDDNDIGGLSMLRHPHETVDGPVWFVHDGIDGGIGFARAIYEHFDTIAERTLEHMDDCDCDRRRGCPMCVMSENCGNNNDPLDRATARLILDDVLGALEPE